MSVAVPFVALVVAAAGCGGSSVKTDKVEQTMKAVVEGAPSSGGQISIDSVDCPSTVDKKKGAKFDCKVAGSYTDDSGVMADVKGVAKVVATDGAGKRFTYQLTLDGEGTDDTGSSHLSVDLPFGGSLDTSS